MDFSKYLTQTAIELDREIQKILNEWLKDARKTDKNLVPLAKAFVKSCDGGKRIRGVLCKIGYDLASSKFNPSGSLRARIQSSKLNTEILKIASALEILHTAILVHDDIIDESPKRRGQPSLFKSVGVSQAITLGDLGFFLATKIISESNFPLQEKIKALNLFSKTMVDTAMGQMLDIKKGDHIKIAKLKTAKYTIAGPMQIGALLGGGSDKLINKIGEFGEYLGIAFQIKDDILDGEVKELDSEQQLALKYVSEAKKIIPSITKDPKIRKLLEEMGDYLVYRNK